MLNKETLRYKIDGDQIKPLFVKVDGALKQVAEGLLEFWNTQISETKHDIQDGLTPHLYRARNLTVARGLNKLIEDRCTFIDPSGQRSLRESAFALSAKALQAPRADLREHHKAIAGQLSLSSKQLYDQLYADLPHAAILEKACELSPLQLMYVYNMAQAQGLLIYAQNVKVAIAESDMEFRRKLLKALRFRRLLANIQQDEAGNLLLSVSGPAAVLDQHQRYGLNLALFLPAIASAKEWALIADVRAPRKERQTTTQLQLDHSCGLRGENSFLGYVPEEFALLMEQIKNKQPNWRMHDQAPLAVLKDGEVIVPDFEIKIDDRAIGIELFHRWHSGPLIRRIDQLKEGQAPHLLLGIDRSIFKRKEYKHLADDPFVQQRGFLFSNFPSPTALIKSVQQLLA